MIKDAKPYSVSQIFTRDLKWFYQIPIYQRAYTWGVKEWTTLFNDIDENDSGYFLGSIICVNNSSSTISQKVTFQVIDGQQRITSLSILLLALYNKIMSTGGSFTESQQDSLKDIKKEIVSITNDDDEIYSARLSLQIQDSNNNDYIALLSENKLLEEASKPKNAGNRRIYRAYKTFLGLIDNYIEGEEKPIKALFSLAKKVNGAVMVFIEVDTNKDAYMLFESLNNRGIPLSAIDLIKNYLISIADDRHNRSTAEKVYRQWERTVSYLGEDYSIQERFLRQYYNAFREELNKTYRSDDTVAFPLGYLATKSTMLDIYEKMIKDDYESFLNELEEKAKIYAMYECDVINNIGDNFKGLLVFYNRVDIKSATILELTKDSTASLCYDSYRRRLS